MEISWKSLLGSLLSSQTEKWSILRSGRNFYVSLQNWFIKFFYLWFLLLFSFRGRKPGSGRKNGGAGSKGKDKKLSGTESEQEVGDNLHIKALRCWWRLSVQVFGFFFLSFTGENRKTAKTARLTGKRTTALSRAQTSRPRPCSTGEETKTVCVWKPITPRAHSGWKC